MRSSCAIALIVSVLAPLLSPGCKGPYEARGGDRGIEAHEQIVLMDEDLKWPIKVVASKADRTPDARLAIAVDLQNRLEQPLVVQIQTVFKDKDGMSTGDETNWEFVTIPGYSTHTYRVTSGNSQAADFLVRIRRPMHPG